MGHLKYSEVRVRRPLAFVSAVHNLETSTEHTKYTAGLQTKVNRIKQAFQGWNSVSVAQCLEPIRSNHPHFLCIKNSRKLLRKNKIRTSGPSIISNLDIKASYFQFRFIEGPEVLIFSSAIETYGPPFRLP